MQSGWYFADNGFIHGTRHDPATRKFTTYDAPDGQDTRIDNVTDSGAFVGRTLDQLSSTYDGTAFLTTADGVFHPFAAPGVGDAEFQSINIAGLIVGAYEDANDDVHGLIVFVAIDLPTRLGGKTPHLYSSGSARTGRRYGDAFCFSASWRRFS